MKTLIRQLTLCFLATCLIPACGGGEGGSSPTEVVDPDIADTAKVDVILPPGVSAVGWTVQTGGLTSAALDSTNSIACQVSTQSPQLIWMSDAAGNVTLFAIREPGQATLSISTTTTALSMVVLGPLILPDYLKGPAAVTSSLSSLPEVLSLAALIGSGLAGTPGSIWSDPSIDQAVVTASEAAIQALHPGSNKLSGSNKVDITPIGPLSGVLVQKEAFELATGLLTVSVANGANRWIQAFVDKPSNGGNLAANPDILNPGTTGSLSFPASVGEDQTLDVEVNVYGGGLAGPSLSQTDIDRLLIPWLSSFVDEFIIPALRIVVGAKGIFGSKELRSLLVSTIIHKTAINALTGPGGWLTAVQVIKAGFLAVITNENQLLEKAIKDVIRNVAKSVVEKLMLLLIPGGNVIYGAYLLYNASQTAIGLLQSAVVWLNSNVKETFAVANVPPAVTLTASKTSGPSPLHVDFTVTSGYPIYQYQWQWDYNGTQNFDYSFIPPDPLVGTTTGTASTDYVYPGPAGKTFTAFLRVTDIDGAVATRQLQVTTGSLSITPSTPVLQLGETVLLSVKDGAGNNVPASNVSFVASGISTNGNGRPVASIDSTGNVIALTAGTASITATGNSGSVTGLTAIATVTVHVQAVNGHYQLVSLRGSGVPGTSSDGVTTDSGYLQLGPISNPGGFYITASAQGSCVGHYFTDSTQTSSWFIQSGYHVVAGYSVNPIFYANPNGYGQQHPQGFGMMLPAGIEIWTYQVSGSGNVFGPAPAVIAADGRLYSILGGDAIFVKQ